MKNRRVGTLTLGVALILLGILIPIGLLTNFDIWFVLRVSPILLIALGGEVLYYAIRHKEDKLKYDGLSIFMIICITLVTLTGAAVQPMVKRGVEYSKMFQQNTKTAQEKLDQAVGELDIDVDTDVYSVSEDGWYIVFGDESYLEAYANVTISHSSNTDMSKEEASVLMLDMYKAVQSAEIDSLGHIRVNIDCPTKSFKVLASTDNKIKGTTYDWFDNAIQENRNTYYDSDNGEYTSSSYESSSYYDTSSTVQLETSSVESFDSNVEVSSSVE